MFKTVTQQVSFLGGVIASVRKLGELVSKSYERQASAVLKAGETFSASALTFFQVTVTRLMEQKRDALFEAERLHRAELRKLKRLRKRRDDEVAGLLNTLVKVRTTVDGAHGRGTADLFLGLEPDVVRASPRVLLRFAREGISVLTEPAFLLPDTALKSTVLAPVEYAEQILPPMEALEATLDEVDDQRRVTEDAQKVREKALEASRKTIVYGSRLLEALYVLAGEDFHAARLRPRITAIASSEDDPLDPGADGDGEPDDGEPDPGEPDPGEPDDGEPESPNPSV